MGTLGSTARRLKAGLAALFLITLAAALAPQNAYAQAKPALTATAGVGSVTLTWTRTGNTGFGYWVYRQGVTGGGYGDWIDIPGGTAIRTHTVTGLTAGTSYTFQVARAEGTGLNFSVFASGGGYSNGATATPTAAASTKTITLSATSTSITEGNSGFTDVTVTATLGEGAPAADPDTGIFRVSLVPASPAGTATGSNKGSDGCTPPLNPADTDWCFLAGTLTFAEGETQSTKKVRILGDTRDEPNETIKLVSAAQKPGWNTGTLTLTIVDDDDPPTATAPTAPTGLTAMGAGTTQVLLTWTKPAGTITGYKLRYAKTPAKGSATWAAMAGSGANTVRHMVTGLEDDAEYSFMIRAVNASGDGAATGWVTATPMDSCPPVLSPTNLSLAPRSDGFVVTWTAPTDVLRNGWELSYKKTGGSSSSVTISNAAATSRTLTGLDANTEYEISLTATHSTYNPSAVCPPGFRVKATGTTLAAASTKTITLSATSTSITEGNSGFTDVTITVTLGEAAPADFSITVTSDSPLGTAKGSSKGVNPCAAPLNPADTDWCYPDSVTVSIAEGETEGTMKVRILGDTRDESNETIRLLGYKFGWTDGKLTLTITDDDDPPTVAAPAKPTGLSAEAGNRQVKLTWTDPDDDSITRYNMRQKKGAAAWGSWTAITGSDADTTTHTVTGLDNDVEYSFRIRARNSGGNSAQSEVVRATPSASAAVPKPVLSAATAGYGRVTLSWSALSGVTVASWGYQYKPAGGSWSRTRTVTGGSTTSTTVTGLTIGTEYTFRLFAAVSPGVQSVWSDQVKATPTNTVPKPVLTAAGGAASVTLSWSALTGIPITSWGYQYKSTGGWSTTTTVTGGSRTSVRVTGLTGGTDYTFRLFAAVSPGVQSVWSDEVTAKTDPVAPVLTAATSTTSGWIDVTWTHAGGSDEMADADDYVKNAVRFYWWGAQTRLKGETTWTDRTFNVANDRAKAESRSNRFGPGSDYPDGASVEVRVRARGYDSSDAVLNGPWSNIRTVTFKNDTTAALTLTGTPVTVAPGATASYTVALTKAYAGTLRITSDTTAAARVSPASLTFSTTNYNTAQTVTVTGVANGTATINHAFRLTGAAADAIADAGTVDVTVADTPGVTISTAALTVAEGGSQTYTMRLNTPPTSDVTITVAGASGDVTVTGSSLTFTRTDWNQPQTVTVNAGTDTDTATDPDVTLTHSASGGGYASVSIADVVVRVAEKDAVPEKPTDLAAAAGNASATLTWTDPDNPTITKWQVRQKAGSGEWGAWTDIAGSDAGTTSHEVSGLTNGTAYQFEVRAVNGAGNGAGPDAPVTATPTAPAVSGGGGGGSGTTPTTDGSVTVTPTALRVSEGSSASYTVVLDTEPSGTVTVTVGGAAGEVTVAPASLTFTTANYGTAQTVTVTAGTDEDTTDDTATLTHSASGGGYGSVTIDSVAVSVTDTTLLPVLTLVQDPAAVTEGDDIRLTVTADRVLTGNLSVSLTLAAHNASGFDAEDLPGGLGPRSFEAVFGDAASRTGVVLIPTTADTEAEGAEAYRVTLNDAADYAVGSDATAAGVLRDRAPGSVERANRVNEAVLPLVAATAVTQTLGAVTGRIEAVASGESGDAAVQLGAWPSSPNEDAWAVRWDPEPSDPKWQELLDGASFTLALGGGAGKEAPPLALWGRGEWLSLSGSESGVSWDGGLWSAQLGADWRLRPDLLAGAALSYAQGELDTRTLNRAGAEVLGVHETTVTSVHPYAAWLPSDGTTVWASLGYGTGEVRIRELGAMGHTAGLSQWSVAAGGRHVLVEDGLWFAGNPVRLAVKGDGAVAQLRTAAARSGLTALTVKTTRLRVMLEGSYEYVLTDGATLTPALEVGVRHDGGDLGSGVGVEAGASVIWRDAAARWSAQLRTRVLATHEADRDEWGVSARVRLAPAVHGRGTYLNFGPAYGRTDSGLGQWFDDRLPLAVDDATGTGVMERRLDAEVGHGIGLPGPGPLAVVTPWTGLSVAESGGRTVRLGTRYRLGQTLALGVEASHRSGDSAERTLTLRAALRW